MVLRKKTTTQRIFAAFLCIFLLFLLASVSESSESSRRVRVGFYSKSGLQDVAPNGRRSGYNYEYIRAIASWAGWELEFVDGTFSDLYDDLLLGRIDILGGIQYTPARAQIFNFADIPAGNSHSKLLVAKDSNIAFEDFGAFDGITIGIQKGNSNELELQRYAFANNFFYKIAPFNLDVDMTRALRTGEVDAILESNFRSVADEREVARFGSRPFYFVVTRRSENILDELNDAQNRLIVSDPMFQNRLLAKYTSLYYNNMLTFSEAEMNYLSEFPLHRVAYEKHNMPLEFQNETTGEADGVTASIINLIAKRTGLHLEFTPCETYVEALALLASGNVDILCGFEMEDAWDDSRHVRASKPYLEVPMMMISNPNVQENAVAIVEGTMTDFWLSRLTDGMKIVRCATDEESLRALLKGEAKVTYLDTYSANQHLSDPLYSTLEMLAIPNYKKELRVAVSPNSKPELLSVINKGIDTISPTELNELLLSSLLTTTPMSLRAFTSRNPITSLLVAAAVVFLVAAFLIALIWSQQKSARRTREMLYIDPLTNGWTLYRFREEAEQLLKGTVSNDFAFVYMDIAHFKYINDEFGYSEGDRLLKMVYGHLLQSIKRERGEMAARIMADHFALMLRTTAHEATDRVSEILHTALSIPNSNQFPLAISAGIYIRRDGEHNISIMLDRANYARSEAKSSPSHRVLMYSESIRESLREEKDIEALMRDALANGEFTPYFQPKIDMRTGIMVGAEALVRWERPDSSRVISPNRFIPLFEKNGFIVNVDRYIYEQVCKHIQRWRVKYGEIAPISCNFSRLHFRDNNFCSRLLEVAGRYRVPASSLELEITESMAMESTESLIAIISFLKKTGFRIAVDDFGSGYSSLGLLQKIQANVLKLDKRFADSIEQDTEQAIVSGVVEIAEKLRMEIVCEGVETREQAVIFQSLNCHVAQGYYYARPMNLETFERLVEKTYAGSPA